MIAPAQSPPPEERDPSRRPVLYPAASGASSPRINSARWRRLAIISSPWVARARFFGCSLLRHPDLAQAGEKGCLGQSADIRSVRYGLGEFGDAEITVIITQLPGPR